MNNAAHKAGERPASIARRIIIDTPIQMNGSVQRMSVTATQPGKAATFADFTDTSGIR